MLGGCEKAAANHGAGKKGRSRIHQYEECELGHPALKPVGALGSWNQGRVKWLHSQQPAHPVKIKWLHGQLPAHPV